MTLMCFLHAGIPRVTGGGAIALDGLLGLMFFRSLLSTVVIL